MFYMVDSARVTFYPLFTESGRFVCALLTHSDPSIQIRVYLLGRADMCVPDFQLRFLETIKLNAFESWPSSW